MNLSLKRSVQVFEDILLGEHFVFSTMPSPQNLRICTKVSDHSWALLDEHNVVQLVTKIHNVAAVSSYGIVGSLEADQLEEICKASALWLEQDQQKRKRSLQRREQVTGTRRTAFLAT